MQGMRDESIDDCGYGFAENREIEAETSPSDLIRCCRGEDTTAQR